MNLTFTEEEEAFRQEVRAWIRDAMPDDMRERAEGSGGFTPEDSANWHRIPSIGTQSDYFLPS